MACKRDALSAPCDANVVNNYNIGLSVVVDGAVGVDGALAVGNLGTVMPIPCSIT